MNLLPPHWAIAFPLSKGPKNAHFICIVGGRWFGFFFIDSLYYIHTYVGDTAQNSSLICTTKKNYPKKLDKTAKIARDYAENAPKALVIYRFRTTTNSESIVTNNAAFFARLWSSLLQLWSHFFVVQTVRKCIMSIRFVREGADAKHLLRKHIQFYYNREWCRCWWW